MSKNLGDLVILTYLGQIFYNRVNRSKNIGNLVILT